MALTYPVFFAAYAISLVVAIFVGVVVLVGWKDIFIRKALLSLKYNLVYIAILASFPLFVLLQVTVTHLMSIPDQTSREVVYTNWIFSFSGGAIRILQDRLDYRLLTDFFIIAYAWVFAYITYFVPVLLLVKDDRATLRKYAVAMMLNYVVLTPFYFLFPVSVSGSHPESGMTPQLYVSTNWGRMVTSIDPLNNDFPSAHVSLSATTFLVFAYAGVGYRKLKYFLGGATIAIVFAVLYLGIHWPADVFAGFILAVGATVASNTEKVQMTIDRYVRIVSEKLFRRTDGQVTESKKP